MTAPLPQPLADLGLSAFPFPKAPAVDMLFRWRGLNEALARLDFALAATGFALLTGEVGAGKSSTLRLFLHRLDANVHPAVYVADSHLSPRTFYGRVLAHFGVLPPATAGRAREQFQTLLADLALPFSHNSDAMLQESEHVGRPLRSMPAAHFAPGGRSGALGAEALGRSWGETGNPDD